MGDIKGETSDKYFGCSDYTDPPGDGAGSKGAGGSGKGAFELKDWNFDVSNKSSIGSFAGGAGTGKAGFGEFSISKAVDAASPFFFNNCVAGAHYKTVTLSCRKAGADPKATGKPYLVYMFGTVFTTKVSWKHSDDGPSEDITFVYGELKVDYVPQSKAGTLDGAKFKEGSWSVLSNTQNTTLPQFKSA